MLKMLKKQTIALSLVAATALVPTALSAASAGGFVEGSSESTSALLEAPNVEKQLHRINTGVNVVRINNDILFNMPVSENSEWVDKVMAPITEEDQKVILDYLAFKDPYFATAGLTNAILGQPGVMVSPLMMRTYYILNVLYKDKPALDEAPEISNLSTFKTFKTGKLITVEATSGNLYKNVEEATISLTSEESQESINKAKEDFKAKQKAYEDLESEAGEIEAWLDDDKNANSPDIAAKKEELTAKEAEVDAAEAEMNIAEEVFYKSLEEAAKLLETNIDESKFALALKLEKLLDTVDDNAVRAVSLFASATAHFTKNGFGSIDQELQAIAIASDHNEKTIQRLKAEGNEEQAKKAMLWQELMGKRKTALAVNAIYAIPSIAMGTYYAGSQSSYAGELQQIVSVVVDAAKAAEEAKAAAQEAESADAVEPAEKTEETK